MKLSAYIMLFVLVLSSFTHAQQNKYSSVHQKVPESAELRPEGGFAAGPRTGVVAGETRSLGLEGIEIDLPTIKLKFPSIRIPGLTQYRRGPRMLYERGVAPFVPTTEVRQEFSIEAAPESGLTEPESGTLQRAKASQHSGVSAPASSWPAAEENEQYAERIQALEALENRLDAKLQRLAMALEQLSAMQELTVVETEAQPASSPSPTYPPVAFWDEEPPTTEYSPESGTGTAPTTPLGVRLLELMDQRLSSFFRPTHVGLHH